jgi:hypothetical protein
MDDVSVVSLAAECAHAHGACCCLGAAAATPRRSEALEAQLLIEVWEYDLQGGIVRCGWGDEVDCAPDYCYNCGQPGHHGAQCDAPRVDATMGEVGSLLAGDNQPARGSAATGGGCAAILPRPRPRPRPPETWS